MSSPDSAVTDFVNRAGPWRCVIEKLRAVLLDCGLTEGLKWGKPCYTIDGRNVAIIQPFKAHCALMFFKGVLLEDTHDQLRRQGPNSQSARRLEFDCVEAIKKTVVSAYVKQAVAIERSGRDVRRDATEKLVFPKELVDALGADGKLSTAFHALTPGRQRGYVLHFGGAKQSKTRAARIEKCIPRILAGKGMRDR